MHPDLFRIGHVTIPSYGVFAAMGILVAAIVALVLARREGIPANFILDAIFWAVVAGFAGARALYLIIDWRETLREPVQAIFSTGGEVFFGGVVTGAIAIISLCRKYRIPIPQAADIFAPPLALGHAIGRVGCFMAGCCYGCPATGALSLVALKFPKLIGEDGKLQGSWPYLDHLGRRWVTLSDPASLPVIPVQLIEAALNVLLFAVLLLLLRRRQFQGQIGIIYIGGYALLRFCVEFMRGDEIRGLVLGLSISQWVCLAITVAMIGFILRPRRVVT